MYFKALPKMYYPYKAGTDTRHTIVTDIFRRVHLDKYFQNRLALTEIYLNDGETETPRCEPRCEFYDAAKCQAHAKIHQVQNNTSVVFRNAVSSQRI